MKGLRIGGIAAAGMLCLVLAGCSGGSGSWEIPSFMRSQPPVPEPHHFEPSAGGEISNTPPATQVERQVEHRRPAAAPARVEPASTGTPAPPAEPLPRPTVTLADGPSKERAQQLLDQAGAKLAKVDRGALGADSATTYDQANNFLQAGRRAATEDDYVAASGFAEKAAVLAAKLAPASH
jgi:hypothetical protein